MTQSTTAMEREIAVQHYDSANLQKELTWGLSYRALKEAGEHAPVRPKHSPINVPFKLCRAVQKTKPKKLCKCTMVTPGKVPPLSLLDRSVLSQHQYMNYLSIPNRAPEKKKKCRPTKSCGACKLEPCPPRLIQMAVPKKVYVLENWRTYQDVLPTEMLMRFDQILKSGNNLEPRDARYYFKRLQDNKRKEIKKKKRLAKKKKKEAKRGDNLWLEVEILELVEAIVRFIQTTPLMMLNFQQMVTSDGLLKYLSTQKVVNIKSRNTKNVYKKTVVEISDKLVKWMDTMSFFADIQPIDSKEAMLEMPSLVEMMEGEESSEGGEEEEEEEKRLATLKEQEDMGDMLDAEAAGAGDAGLEEFLAEKIVDRTKVFSEEEEGSMYDMLKDLDEESLQKLILILSESPETLLAEEIDPDNLPGVTYNDVLEKLKDIRDNHLMQQRYEKVFLEDRIIEWAKHNDPESVDDKVLNKIHEASEILSEVFFKRVKESGDDQAEGKIPVEEVFMKEEVGGVEAAIPTIIEEEITETGEGVAETGQEAAPETGQEAAPETGQEAAPETGQEAAPETGEGVVETAQEEAPKTGEEGVTESEGEVVTESGGEGPPESGGEGPPESGGEGAPEVVAEAAPETAGEQAPVTEAAEGAIPPGTEAGAPEIVGEGVPETGEGAPETVAATPETGEAPPEIAETEAATPTTEEGAPEAEAGLTEVEPGQEAATEEIEAAEDLTELPEEGEGLTEEELQILSDEEAYLEAEGDFEFGEGEGEIEVLTKKEDFVEGAAVGEPIKTPPEDAEMGRLATELEKLDSLLGLIRGHKPSVVFEHEPGTICCLSLKIWAVWLLEIANNAHNWTKWISDIIRQVRYYAGVIRGDVELPSGEKKVLYKEEWRKFVKDTEDKVVSWRQYSNHVKDLSTEIMDSFHGKHVTCCQKCLQDHLIKNVVTAHETLLSLTEAINCAGYWQRCLDKIVEQTSKITDLEVTTEGSDVCICSIDSDESYIIEIEEVTGMPGYVKSEESIYEIEELPVAKVKPKICYVVQQLQPPKVEAPTELKKKTEPSKTSKLKVVQGGKPKKGKKK